MQFVFVFHQIASSGDRLSEVDVFVYFALEWLHNGYDFSFLLLLLFCLHFFSLDLLLM